MQRNNKYFFMPGILAFLLSCLMITTASAGIPLWTFKPLTETTVTVPSNTMAIIQYRVTNQSKRQHTLNMLPIQGIVQVTTGQGVCGNPFVLKGNHSCTLSLQVSGSQLKRPITGGPVVCQQGNPNQCYRPANDADALHITPAPPVTDTVITITSPPLELTVGGSPGEITIFNSSADFTATNIQSNFTGTALAGHVQETGNTCKNLLPQRSCTLTFSPIGDKAVPVTPFPVKGDNTNELTPIITILPAPPSGAVISVTGSPLQLTANGSNGQLTIKNTSTDVIATNIESNFTGTDLEGHVQETGNTCQNLLPQRSCTLTFSPIGDTAVSETKFPVKGDNTNELTPIITILPAHPSDAVISVSESPLQLIANGSDGQLTIKNTSTGVTATNIQPDFTDTDLEGLVMYSAINCQSIGPQESCILTFSPGNTAIQETNFPIQGDNTIELTAAIAILPAPPSDAVILVTDSPLELTASGSNGELTIENTSTEVTATNILSNFTGTDLENKVTEADNTCQNVPPGESCTLTYQPGSEEVQETEFTIQGDNTNELTAAIAIAPGVTLTGASPSSGPTSGGTSVTLTGTGLSGRTEVKFGEFLATDLNEVTNTQVTAVTPAHAEGLVDVEITTSIGTATLTNGYEYLAPAVGQPTGGGRIACLDGGFLNLIAATADSNNDLQWGKLESVSGAQDSDDGASNTRAIVAANIDGDAAVFCNNYQIDSQGQTPCGTDTCYDDWFLPAREQLACLYRNRASIGGFDTNVGTWYWSSTERGSRYPYDAWRINFNTELASHGAKSNNFKVRCVRAFSP